MAARTLAQEARGEPPEGQHAVAWVIRNRLQSGRWGHSLSSVCLWRSQFSGWGSADPNFSYACGLQDTDPVLQHMRDAIQKAMAETTDPTGGAMFYYATIIAAPYWVDETKFCGQFGNQRFYSGTK